MLDDIYAGLALRSWGKRVLWSPAAPGPWLSGCGSELTRRLISNLAPACSALEIGPTGPQVR
jgi:hypothetical protein